MNRLKHSDKIMIAGITYTIGTGKADVQKMIKEDGEPGDTVDVGSTTYHIIGQNGNAAFKQIGAINNEVNPNTSTVSIGTDNYELKNGNYTAEFASTVAGKVNSSTKSVTITGANGNSTTYTLIDGSGNVAEHSANIRSRIDSGMDSITYGGVTYNKNSSNAYVSSTDSSVIKTLNDIRSDIGDNLNGQTVTIKRGSNTYGYVVRNYNYNDIRSYVSGASVGEGTSATTRVTIDGDSYSLRKYNLSTVKNRLSNFSYDEGTTEGSLIKVDGNSYTAETNLYRSAICIAYGEDNEMDTTKPGAGKDDPINGNTVTFHGVTYTLMVDQDGDGYDDDDRSVITEGRAYKLIARELEKASNIGATDTYAKVRDKNNEDIDDGVTMAADFLEDPDNDASRVIFEIDRGTTTISKDLNTSIHAGADADMNNKIGVSIEAMSAKNLGIWNLNVVDDNGIGATYALDAIEDAIKEVSRQRSELGAVQNRMEHTIKNLDNVVENTTASESRLRDTDMADEMVKYSINNILAQAGQSMLVQANQSTQGVMTLLQG
ncbi:flagellin [Butyrivibrio sp. AE3004]|uniref:flagellin n=1 Tax=Butyrivibrio sp. AE3004 TaxID=1506994 RepID=UPI003FA47365